MHVLHLGKYYPPFAGGIENFMSDLMRASVRQGVKVSAIVHRHDGRWNSRLQRPPDARTQPAVYRVPSYGQLLYAPISPAFGWHLKRLLDRLSPDLLHVHMPNTSAFWLLLPGLRPPPMLLHWHADVVSDITDPALRGAYRLYRPLEQALLRRAERVIVTSPDYLRHSAPLRRWRSKCELVPLGLSPERLQTPPDAPPSGLWRHPGHLKLLSLGRLTPYKGHRHLIEAVHTTPGVELIIAGDGALRAQLARHIEHGPAADRMQLIGGLGDSLRNQLIVESDLLCLTSVNRAEAFGLVIVEAKALSTPTLASKVTGSGMSWIVQHGNTGWQCRPGDSASIAERLRHARDHREQLARMGQAAKRQFDAQFHIDVVADRIGALYDDATATGTRNAHESA